MQVVNFKSFIVVSLMLIFSFFFSLFNYIVTYIFVLFLHEMVHICTAKYFGYKMDKMMFLPYGSVVYGKNTCIIDKHQIIIAISAPILNIAIAFVFVALWWVFPQIYEHTFVFVSSNISLGFFNLLPIFPLDGGRALMATLRSKTKFKRINLFFIIVTIIFIIFFVSIFILSLFYKINLTYLFIAFFLVLSLFDYKATEFFNCRFNEKDFNKLNVLPKREFIVSSGYNLRKLIKYIKDDYYCEFIFLRNGKIIKKLSENELLDILKK